jgi:DNA-binding response OmpR family regulator
MDVERGDTHGRNVLVVDDEASLRLLCRVNLELEGHRVREASTLAEARAELEREVPGLELLDEIDTLDLPTRVVLLSGTSEVGPDLRERVDVVLGKPFDLRRLAAAVVGSIVR